MCFLFCCEVIAKIDTFNVDSYLIKLFRFLCKICIYVFHIFCIYVDNNN